MFIYSQGGNLVTLKEFAEYVQIFVKNVLMNVVSLIVKNARGVQLTAASAQTLVELWLHNLNEGIRLSFWCLRSLYFKKLKKPSAERIFSNFSLSTNGF